MESTLKIIVWIPHSITFQRLKCVDRVVGQRSLRHDMVWLRNISLQKWIPRYKISIMGLEPRTVLTVLRRPTFRNEIPKYSTDIIGQYSSYQRWWSRIWISVIVCIWLIELNSWRVKGTVIIIIIQWTFSFFIIILMSI